MCSSEVGAAAGLTSCKKLVCSTYNVLKLEEFWVGWKTQHARLDVRLRGSPWTVSLPTLWLPPFQRRLETQSVVWIRWIESSELNLALWFGSSKLQSQPETVEENFRSYLSIKMVLLIANTYLEQFNFLD